MCAQRVALGVQDLGRCSWLGVQGVVSRLSLAVGRMSSGGEQQGRLACQQRHVYLHAPTSLRMSPSPAATAVAAPPVPPPCARPFAPQSASTEGLATHPLEWSERTPTVLPPPLPPQVPVLIDFVSSLGVRMEDADEEVMKGAINLLGDVCSCMPVGGAPCQPASCWACELCEVCGGGGGAAAACSAQPHSSGGGKPQPCVGHLGAAAHMRCAPSPSPTCRMRALP